MSRWTRRRAPIRIPHRPELAAPPGVLAPVTDTGPVQLEILRFGPDAFDREVVETPAPPLGDLRGGAPVVWVNVEGTGDVALLRELACSFGWHSLLLEDAISQHQRPKAEDYDDHAYVVVHMPSGAGGLPLEQLSIVFGEGYVVTIQAGAPGDSLAPIRERLRRARGRIRSAGPDYLVYSLIDAVVDHYFPIVEGLNARLEAIEASLERTDDTTFGDIHAIRNDLHTIWRTVSATREAVSQLVRGEIAWVTEATRLYLRDCQDHCAQLLDAVEACRELSASLMELHQTAISNRMGEGMRILTMIATIFIPMSFIAGLYGMNFDRGASPLNMPELGWYFGYPFALALMLTVGLLFVAFFRRRGWLGGRRARARPVKNG